MRLTADQSTDLILAAAHLAELIREAGTRESDGGRKYTVAEVGKIVAAAGRVALLVVTLGGRRD